MTPAIVRRIAWLVTLGLGPGDIAYALGLSARAVRMHLREV